MFLDSVSPLELKVYDFVKAHGAIFEVRHITLVDGVAACTSKLMSDDLGSIPRSFLETPEEMAARGCVFAANLPAGLYWNIQGNANARAQKIIFQ